MNVIRPLEPWLESRIMSTLTDPNVHYESSQYGPINGLLSHVFPIQRRFMVKPQAKLRPVGLREELNDARTSIDSNSNEMLSRTTAGGKRETGIDEPDFVIVKSGPNYGDDVPVAIVEIKRNDRSYEQDIKQMERYMRHIHAMRCASDLKGYLVAKDQTVAFDLSRTGHSGTDIIFTHSISTRQELKSTLEYMAGAHWNF
jgi:hypothetical protein